MSSGIKEPLSRGLTANYRLVRRLWIIMSRRLNCRRTLRIAIFSRSMDTGGGGGWLALQKMTLSATLVSLSVEGAEWNPASSGGKELACWPGSNQREPARRCVGENSSCLLKKIHWSLGILKPTVFTKTEKNNCLSSHTRRNLIRIVERKLNINN